MSTEKFESSPIFDLQQELLRVKKEFASKEAEWKRQRTMLIQQKQMISMELMQMKHLQSNLRKVNETLQLVQPEKKQDSIKDMLNEIWKTGLERKGDNSFEQRQQQKYRRKQMALRQEHEHEMERRVNQKQESMLIRFQNEIIELQTQNQNLRMTVEKLESEASQYKSEVLHLRKQLERPPDSINSFVSSETNRLFGCASNPKQSSRQVNASHMVSEMLCQVCNEVFATNDFYQHTQECCLEQEENIEELLNRKRYIENQLQMLQYKKPSKPKKIIMIVDDKPRKRKKEMPFLKGSDQSSPSNSLKSSAKGRLFGF